MADMTDGGGIDDGGQASGRRPAQPQGHFAGIPYDWRPPTVERLKARWWNPDEGRLFTPRVWGWGYDLNLYWVTHPRGYRKK